MCAPVDAALKTPLVTAAVVRVRIPTMNAINPMAIRGSPIMTPNGTKHKKMPKRKSITPQPDNPIF